MPNYSSKSQSKSGGRRRKRTLKNVRRRKSRKVMRGGENMTYGAIADKMGVFGDEFEIAFGKSWTGYLSSMNKTESDTVDVDVLKQDTIWNTFAPFKRAFS